MKQLYVLAHQEARKRALQAIQEAPEGYRVTVEPPKRTLDQNALLWPLLHEISRQVKWDGETLTPEEWKDLFTASMKKQKVVRGIDGGLVFLGDRTSKMTKADFSDLLDYIQAFGAERGVRWGDAIQE